MNDNIVIGALFGTCIGLLIGYIFKHYQDARVIKEIQKINDDLIRDLKDTFARREEIYKLEINRLNDVIAQSPRGGTSGSGKDDGLRGDLPGARRI